MKKIIFLTIGVLPVVILLQSFGTIGFGKKEGTEPGYTGSPGDTLKNCTACHGGTATNVEGWITSNIPATGYVPGNTYTVTATNTESEGTRFGFQVSPQSITGNLLGKIVVTDTSATQLVGEEKYITYTAKGVDGSGFRSWSFDWIAPPQGTRDVVFYGAFNSNFNGHKDGDKTFLSSLKVYEQGTVGLSPTEKTIKSFSVYPNPVSYQLSIELDLEKASNVTLDLMDLTGRRVASLFSEKLIGSVTKQINLNTIPNGNYLVYLVVDGNSSSKKIVVKH